MAIPTPDELLAMLEAGELAGQMARRFGLKDTEELRVTEARCAELHNTGAADILGLVEGGELQALDSSSFFLATHFFCRVLADLQDTPERMMACVEALVQRGGEDMMANQPNAALRSWCEKDPARSWAIVGAARAGDELAMRHLTFALEALQDIPEARRLAMANESGYGFSAITALGRIPDPDGGSREETFSAFAALLERSPDDRLKLHLLQATAFLLSQKEAFPTEAAVELIRRITESPSGLVIHQAAHVLWAYPGVLHPQIVPLLLGALCGVDPDNAGTVNEVDLALQTLLNQGFADAAVAFVTELFGDDERQLELTRLESFMSTLLDGPNEVFARTVVRWLRKGAPRLCDGLSQVVRRGRDEDPILDLQEALAMLTGPEQFFVCRKAIGWFFLKPKTAASVLVCALRVCDEATGAEIQRLLVEPLLLNYGGAREYLETLDEGDAAKPRVQAALAENQAYRAGLQATPDIKELHPSEAHRRIQHLRMSDQMRDIAKQAREQSVFLQLVKRSVLLYGARSLSFVRDPDDTLRAVETDLHAHGVSFELPRMEIVDPVGLDHTMRVFRVERMAS